MNWDSDEIGNNISVSRPVASIISRASTNRAQDAEFAPCVQGSLGGFVTQAHGESLALLARGCLLTVWLEEWVTAKLPNPEPLPRHNSTIHENSRRQGRPTDVGQSMYGGRNQSSGSLSH